MRGPAFSDVQGLYLSLECVRLECALLQSVQPLRALHREHGARGDIFSGEEGKICLRIRLQEG